MPNLPEDEYYDKQPMQAYTSIFVIIVLLWMLLGLAAFLASLICFGKSGTAVDKIFGFLLAIFFGPVYWIYFFVNKSYCRRK